MAFTESVRSFQVPATPGTIAWPPSLPSVPTSRATRVTSEANERSWSTMVLMASFSCRISPRTSTVIFLERSPLATAMVTSAMLRTWPVRFDAIEFTDSVRSRHTPVTSTTCAWPPSLPSVPTSRATRVTSEVNTESWPIIALTIIAERRNSPFSGRPSTSSGMVCIRSPLATAEMVRVTWVVGHSRSSISVLTDCSMSPQAPLREAEAHAGAGLALAADHLADLLQLLGHARVGGDDVVEGVRHAAGDAGAVAGQAHGEVADPHRLQGGQQLMDVDQRGKVGIVARARRRVVGEAGGLGGRNGCRARRRRPERHGSRWC